MNFTNQSYIFERYRPITSMFEEFSPVGVMAEKILPPVWYIAGFIGNPISAFIWLGQRMRRNNSSAVYLGFLSLTDMIFLMLNLMYLLHTTWGYKVYNDHVSCEIFLLAYYVPQYLSTFLVMGFTVERYVAVCHPFMKEKWCTVRKALIIILFLSTFSFLLASAHSYLWAYHTDMDVCSHRQNVDSDFITWWILITDVAVFVLVPVIVLIFNVMVIREISKISKNNVVHRQQNRRGNGVTSTVTLLAVSFYLILTQISATVVGLLHQAFPFGDPFMSDEDIRKDQTWSRFFTFQDVRKVVEVICLSHYAIYFFIYCATGKHFQKEVLYLLTLQGRLPFLATMLSTKRRKEHYTMVSTNGCAVSEMYTTNMSTTI
uniref:G-protein coupled receptors family 1 profile domain-containing protein n=1 Tax=Biomphalaria glabrata TaxID=6526 RepID=A0A2C9KQY2_BIOGL